MLAAVVLVLYLLFVAWTIWDFDYDLGHRRNCSPTAGVEPAEPAPPGSVR
ncbi:hypothetical protein [Streptomyces oceani]|nr:hypothetical protein [Streptomyces oceani]